MHAIKASQPMREIFGQTLLQYFPNFWSIYPVFTLTILHDTTTTPQSKTIQFGPILFQYSVFCLLGQHRDSLKLGNAINPTPFSTLSFNRTKLKRLLLLVPWLDWLDMARPWQGIYMVNLGMTPWWCLHTGALAEARLPSTGVWEVGMAWTLRQVV